ncbi:dTDP-4-dehydrorhamnose reductase family protein [Azospirillum halopraeferens]|uniref:dTDP-4-dehydrorhamnose reductase family protein n=1 Tax=Azospirillum halopraeferens TaxID=34010 RepID=UPI000686310D|nr:SDR family oxidoreductase [Azospirillum halopraeferens]
MNVLVLGGDGMLGHRLFLHLLQRLEVHCTIRGTETHPAISPERCHTAVDIRDLGAIARVVAAVRPDVVVNCAGLVKQRPSGQAVVDAAAVNSIAPHQIAALCGVAGARFIQISTDCVFSGRRGRYSEEDTPDPVDTYGMTKLLGEVTGPRCLTLRTSIVGRELKTKLSLLEWFLAKNEPVRGYRNAIFSGVTSVELARIIERIIVRNPDAAGLYHVSGEPIGKYDLLQLFARCYDHPISIIPDESVVIDRSLDSTRFREAFGYRPPGWHEMLADARREERDLWG